MAEGPIIECPATPERIDQCPATPDRFLVVKTPDSSTASSDNDFSFRGRSTGSPPPNCAICLGKCKNKSFTDSCLHQFCFKCLLEWSKVKPECPLCKQGFKSIIHNVKSIDQFEEYLVRPQQTNQSIPIPRPMPTFTARTAARFTQFAARRGHPSYPQRFDVFLSEMPRFRSEILNSRNGFSATVQVHPTDNDTLQQMLMHRAAVIDRLRQFPNEAAPAGSLGQIWRRFIYEKRLYALPVVDITGRFRECSARFYRDNPAQTHRLMPWLNRDLVCLLRDTEHHVSYVLNILSDLLTVYNITSPEFRRRCQPYLRRRTSHFIHEFVNFARSPYDMIGYDREVRYAPYYEEVILSSSDMSSSTDTDRERERTARRRGRTEFVIGTRADFSRFILSAAHTFNEPWAIPGFLSSAATPINLTLESTEEAPSGIEQPQVLGQNDVIQIDRNIVLSSSSSDECEFVMEQKPPHLRTPEMVTLNSETDDSDVVFVCESKSKSLPPTSSLMKQVARNRKRKLPKGVFESSQSTSSDTDSDNEEHVENKSSSIKQEESKPNPEETSQVKEESNTGASTSSGIGSSECKTSNSSTKKYYARPVRKTRYKSRRSTKSIYEESSTDSEASTPEYSSYSCSESDTDSSSSGEKGKRKRRRKHKYSSKRRKTESKSKKKKSKKSHRKDQKRKKSTRQRSRKYSSSSSTSSSLSSASISCSPSRSPSPPQSPSSSRSKPDDTVLLFI